MAWNGWDGLLYVLCAAWYALHGMRMVYLHRYAQMVLDSGLVGEHFVKLKRKMKTEIALQKDLAGLMGMMETIIAAGAASGDPYSGSESEDEGAATSLSTKAATEGEIEEERAVLAQP